MKARKSEEFSKVLSQVGEFLVTKYGAIENAYMAMDPKAKGKISYKKFSSNLHHMGLPFPAEQRVALANFIDSKKKGKIRLKDMQKVFRNKVNPDWISAVIHRFQYLFYSSRIGLKAAFKIFEPDTCGCIRYDEFREVLIAIGLVKDFRLKDQQIRELYQILDKDRCGSINFSDFSQTFQIVDVWEQKKKEEREEAGRT